MCLLLLLMCRSFVCTRPSLRHNRLCLHNHHPPICAFPYPLHRRRVLIGLQGNKINILAVSPPPPHHHRFESVCSLCRCCATVPLLFVRLHPPLPPQPPPPINLCLPTTHRPLARIAHYNGTNHTLAVSLFAPLLLCCHCQALLPLSSEFIGLCFLPVLFEECKRERESCLLWLLSPFFPTTTTHKMFAGAREPTDGIQAVPRARALVCNDVVTGLLFDCVCYFSMHPPPPPSRPNSLLFFCRTTRQPLAGNGKTLHLFRSRTTAEQERGLSAGNNQPLVLSQHSFYFNYRNGCKVVCQGLTSLALMRQVHIFKTQDPGTLLHTHNTFKGVDCGCIGQPAPSFVQCVAARCSGVVEQTPEPTEKEMGG